MPSATSHSRSATSSTRCGSWVISSTAPWKSASAFTSASRASMSRWLVGSSRISSCGASRVASASSSRAFSPPDRLADRRLRAIRVQPETGELRRAPASASRAAAPAPCGRSGSPRRPVRPSGAGRSSRRAAWDCGASRRPAVEPLRPTISPAWTCRCRWRPAARCGRPCRSSARGRAAPARRHSRRRHGPAPGSAGRCAPARESRSGSASSSITVSICGSRASALMRACAWRALLAL